MNNIQLYYIPTCPFCMKVIDFLKENNLDVTLVNRDERSEHRDKLIEIGGKTQVPCLVIDGQAKYESDDIIEWFRENCVK